MQKILAAALVCSCILGCNNNKPADSATASSPDSATAEKKPLPQSEFADPKYVDIGKQGLADFSSGNIDGWMNSFADNAVFRWSSGDSLSGKAAIASYWKERRSKVIDSITFSNDIWLPIKVNQPQKGPDVKGIWLLAWEQVSSKYKNGKRLVFWVHRDMHFDSNDKIDLYIEYIDRAPINKALQK